jgi:hypothetical protein
VPKKVKDDSHNHTKTYVNGAEREYLGGNLLFNVVNKLQSPFTSSERGQNAYQFSIEQGARCLKERSYCGCCNKCDQELNRTAGQHAENRCQAKDPASQPLELRPHSLDLTRSEFFLIGLSAHPVTISSHRASQKAIERVGELAQIRRLLASLEDRKRKTHPLPTIQKIPLPTTRATYDALQSTPWQFLR